MSENLLEKPVDYRVQRTRLGQWHSYLYPSGALFTEFRSHARLAGLPLLHYTRGICPETGRRRVARGWIAVGRIAVGFLALGQLALGPVAIGQAAFGLVAGLGQAATGALAVGQLAAGSHVMAQLGMGRVVVAQLGAGEYVLAQMGYGPHVWSSRREDPVAVAFFRDLARRLAP
jgi:hypothetical protein